MRTAMVWMAVVLTACRTGGAAVGAWGAEIAAPVREPVPWQKGVAEADDLPTARLQATYDAKLRVLNWVGGQFVGAEHGGVMSERETRTRLTSSFEAVMRACGGLEFGEETYKRLASGRISATVKVRPRVGMLNGPDARAACERAVAEAP